MIEIEDFQNYIEILKIKDWKRLFDLLPQIEKTQKYGEIKGGKKLKNGSITDFYWSWSEIVEEAFDVITELNLNPIFDWSSWKEGKSYLDDNGFDYSKLDTITLCKLLTTIIRADRFNDGYMISCFQSGTITKIIKGLQKNVNSKNYTSQIKSVLFGVAVGDALGVPVEFKTRETIRKNPVTDMMGYGTYNLPAGTFSDDSSLTFCLAEALTKKFDLNTIGENFVKWCYDNYWTPKGNVFDIGIATQQAIDRLAKGEQPDLAGGFDISSNGNGSLMRISPLLFYLLDKPIKERYEITKQVSSITHGHVRSVIACFYYLEFARQLLAQKNKFEIYKNLQTEVANHLTLLSINATEVALFDRLLKQEIHELTEEYIFSSGYVLHTLEASIWCLLTTDNYKEAVLKAVNLGEDTDTTAAVTGGLAGLLYGLDGIPSHWINQIARNDEIEDLAERLGDRTASS